MTATSAKRVLHAQGFEKVVRHVQTMANAIPRGRTGPALAAATQVRAAGVAVIAPKVTLGGMEFAILARLERLQTLRAQEVAECATPESGQMQRRA